MQVKKCVCLAIALLCGGIPSAVTSAIEFGQIDTFEDGNPAGWQQGQSSPTQPSVITDQTNHALELTATGQTGPGGKLIMFNLAQWTGNYAAAGIERIQFDVRNNSGGAQPVFMRISMEGGTALFGAVNAVEVPDDGTWHVAKFDLTADAIQRLTGTGTLQQGLANITALRILSAQNQPSFNGDAIAANVWIDNIQATFIPLPADLNADRAIDASDAGIMFANWGQPGEGDINADGIVDAADAGEMFAVWTGDSAPIPAAAVPEPCSFGSFVLGCLGLTWVRQRRGLLLAS